MQLYRVFPHLPDAEPGQLGHALTVAVEYQGLGRFDNPHLYAALYVSSDPAGAIGEVFQSQLSWTADMLAFPAIAGSVRRLATFTFNEERHPLLDLDDARTIVELGVRPSDVVKRDRTITQRIAADVYAKGRYVGLSSFSNVRPQWRIHVLWDHDGATLQRVEDLPGHPALIDANTMLYRPALDKSLR